MGPDLLSVPRAAVDELVSGVVGHALQKHGARLARLPASQRLCIAEQMASVRCKMVDSLLKLEPSAATDIACGENESGGGGTVTVTGDLMRSLVAKLTDEVGGDG